MESLPAELKLTIFHLSGLHPDSFQTCLALSSVSPEFHATFLNNKRALLKNHIRQTIRAKALPYYRLVSLMRTEKRAQPAWNKDGTEDRKVHVQGHTELRSSIETIAKETKSGEHSMSINEMCEVISARRILRQLLRKEYKSQHNKRGTDGEAISDALEVGACLSLLGFNNTLQQLEVDAATNLIARYHGTDKWAVPRVRRNLVNIGGSLAASRLG